MHLAVMWTLSRRGAFKSIGLSSDINLVISYFSISPPFTSPLFSDTYTNFHIYILHQTAAPYLELLRFVLRCQDFLIWKRRPFSIENKIEQDL